jgi:hypothetical protein
MARSWTRLHEHLGVPPGPLDFDMVAKAAAGRLAESDDLDWKEHLPQPPREGRWNELAKDVAAMANTRGGLIIFGVQDTTCELTGIDPAEVKPEQYAQWIRSHVHPSLSGLTFTTLTSPDKGRPRGSSGRCCYSLHRAAGCSGRIRTTRFTWCYRPLGSAVAAAWVARCLFCCSRTTRFSQCYRLDHGWARRRRCTRGCSALGLRRIPPGPSRRGRPGR